MPLAVVGNNHESRWIPGDKRLLRYFHDNVVGHTFRWQPVLRAFECRCDAVWIPEIGREDVALTEAVTDQQMDWVVWPTARDHFVPYEASQY